ncbi:DUF6449 domain-containing protein [Bacillus suaedaesalsae]|uniref:DUF6449 domain-containing protein n=1 Tax=Bacillus suaedaesalsae TaxID=2810349 RepID=A0ABS2DK61_9BACI|nr:DUF6449 domain-containing protein [Bacillus suaedaesalsae]MBM6618887.1 hypothetical protein [Bacillus suaedaesalsae]
MQSKTSWFNKQILLQGFRVAGWIGIIYTVALFFVLPINLIMISTNEFKNELYLENHSFYQFTELPAALTIIIPVLVSIFILRFLQVKSSSDLYHSLPIKRKTLYVNFMTVGILLVSLPVIINGLIVAILYPLMDMQLLFDLQSVFVWLGIMMLMNLFIYFSTIFIGMLTGNSMVQGVLSYIFLLFLIGITVLVSMNLDLLLYGYKADYMINHQLERLSPLTRVFFLYQIPFKMMEGIIYTVMTIALAVMSLFIYKARKLEVVSNPIAFQFLKPIFKYGVTFFSMLLGGFYFTVMDGSIGWSIFGYIVGSVIGYVVAEMVLQKTWRILGNIRLKGMMIYAIFAVGLFVFVITDVVGFEKRIPATSEIERVFYSDTDQFYYYSEEGPTQFFYEENNIDNIKKLHERLLQDEHKQSKNKWYTSSFFAYELKNGKKVIREYSIPLTEEYEAYLRPIYESDEYKNVYYRALQLEGKDVEKITFSHRGPGDESVTISDESEIEEILSLLKQDILKESFEETRYGQGHVSEMMIKLTKKETNGQYAVEYESHHSIRSSYTTIINWLKENGKYEDAILSEDEIDYILLTRSDLLEGDKMYTLSQEQIEELIKKDPDTKKVTNREKIKLSLQYMTDGDLFGNNEENYTALVKYKKDDISEIRGLKPKYYNTLIEN